jgi:hypothetical protein
MSAIPGRRLRGRGLAAEERAGQLGDAYLGLAGELHIVGVVFLNALGGSLTSGIFLLLALLSLVFIYRLAPETKGRQLEAIRTYWYNGGPLARGGQYLGHRRSLGAHAASPFL